jgi:uncharacterized protein (UPF0276 family)
MAVFTLVVEYDDPNMLHGVGLKVTPTASLSDFHPRAVEHILDEMQSAFNNAVTHIFMNGDRLSR